MSKRITPEYKLVSKAYEIDLLKIKTEGYFCHRVSCYADNLNKAKVELLKDAKYLQMSLLFSEDEISYINIPVIRHTDLDLYDFNGVNITKAEIDRLTELELILNDPTITHCYIKKGSYYRPKYCGYTDMRHRAGVYPKQEAYDHTKSCRELSIIPINVVEHNKMINDEINDLKSRII